MFVKSLGALVGLGVFALAVPAQAQEETSFTGARIAVTGGWDRIDHDGENGSGFVYGGTAGYDVGFGSVRIGPEVEVTGSTQKTCFTNVADRVCERADRDFYVGGRLGYAVTSKALLYGRVGYTNARFSDRVTPNTTSEVETTVSRDNRSGIRLGAGVEYAVAKHFFLTGEYRYSNYSDGFSRNQILGGVGVRF